MVTVAIAAGSGHVGRTIASVLKHSPKHKVIILSRKAADTEDPEAPTYVVDYGNVDAVAKILQDNHVHTVISAILVMSAEAGEAELDLVKAAVVSAPTKRFISSDWTSPRPKTNPQPFRRATLDALRQTNLEFTTFYVGYFADYLGMPHIETHLLPVVGNIDMEHCQAAIPGDGNQVHAYTYTSDLARFVEAALDLTEGEWDEETYCWSDKATFNQIVKWAEEARGTKFAVVHDSVEKIEAGKVTELPGHLASYAYYPKPLFQQAMAFFELCIVQGLLDFPAEKSLNKRFPDLKTTSVKNMVDAWKGK